MTEKDRIPAVEDCKLYAVDISAMLANQETYSNFFRFLLRMNGNFFNKERLSLMASNPRHQLYVLVGPDEFWNEDEPAVYCAIQVYLEGQIDLPACNDKLVREKISDFYVMFPQLPSLVGARIVQICTLMEEAYDSTAVSLLTRYYNGEMAQDAPELHLQPGKKIFTHLQSRRLEAMHYLGIIVEPNSDELSRWVGRDFSLLFVGKIKDESQVQCVMLKSLYDFDVKISSHNKDCTLNALFRYSRSIFIHSLSFPHMRFLDHVFALRVIKLKFDHEDVDLATEKPWRVLDDKMINSYIKNSHNQELVLHLIPDIAALYFGERLPLMLSTNEEFVLLLQGLQKHDFFHIRDLLNVSEEEIDYLLKGVLAKAMDHFDFPEARGRGWLKDNGRANHPLQFHCIFVGNTA